MKRSFFRFYLALLLSMILLALALEGLLSWQANTEKVWLPAKALFCQQATLPACTDNPARIQRLPITAVELSAQTQQRLQRGEVIALETAGGHATALIQDGNDYLSYGPIPMLDAGIPVALYLYLLFFGLFALLLLVWLWPLFRDLDTVRRTLSEADQRQDVIRFSLPRRSILQPLARIITQLSGQVRQLLHSQRELSHFIAHDLRTPLARMRFALAMLKTEQTDLRQDVLDNINELERIANEYLRYADEEASRPLLTLSLLKAHDFFTPLQQRYRHADPIRVQFAFTPVQTFFADAFALERAIDNLLQNARRYGHAQVRVSLQRRHGCCVLQVDDDGPGIPHAARQVFGRHGRLPETRKANGEPPRVRGDREQGFGIGLYIVRRVAMLHRGRLKLLSSPLGGARFELIWPDAP